MEKPSAIVQTEPKAKGFYSSFKHATEYRWRGRRRIRADSEDCRKRAGRRAQPADPYHNHYYRRLSPRI